ncbi:hypothetical protein [uncultured Nostoc sp.]|nr:hypothetical protein [uncultured Nostoc sp.]
MLQIHDLCCNEILSINDRKFMIEEGGVSQAIAEDKEASPEKTA